MCDEQGTAEPTVLIENDRVRVTQWLFKARGENTGWHRHEYDYVVVPQFTGKLDINVGGGEIVSADMTSGVPYYREIGVEHDVISANDFECSFIEIELLGARNG